MLRTVALLRPRMVIGVGRFARLRAEQVLAGERPLYFALGYGHEPLYAYAVALAFCLLGRTLAAMGGQDVVALFGRVLREAEPAQ